MKKVIASEAISQKCTNEFKQVHTYRAYCPFTVHWINFIDINDNSYLEPQQLDFIQI